MKTRLLVGLVLVTALTACMAYAQAPAQLLPYSEGTRNNYEGGVGVVFVTPAAGPIVNELGFFDADNDGLVNDHDVALWEWDVDTGVQTEVAHVVVPSGTGAKLADGWRWVSVGAVQLKASTRYVLAATAQSGGDLWPDAASGAQVPVAYDPYFHDPSVAPSLVYGSGYPSVPVGGYNAAWAQWNAYRAANMRTVQARATDPSPASGADLVPVDTDLSWTPSTSANVTEQRVYFSESATDPNIYETTQPIKTGDGTLSTVLNSEIGFALARSGQYRWRVDVVEQEPPMDPNVVTGVVWVFQTEPDVPLIDSEPNDLLATPGTDATFEILAHNTVPGELLYQWYKVDAGGDVELADGADYAGATTARLTVKSVDFAADDGAYYCVLDNGKQVTSREAYLTVKTLMGHWTLDEVWTDASGKGYTAEYMDASDPNIGEAAATFAAGIADQSVSLTTDDRFVRATGTEETYNFFGRGLTASAWVKTENAAWQCILSKQLRVTGQDWMGWVLDLGPGGGVNFNIRGMGGAIGGGPVNDGEWHMVTVNFDAQSRIARNYVDGQLAVTTGALGGTPRPTDQLFLIGSETIQGTTLFEGLIDDVRTYNYALSSLEVAKLYFDILPGADDFCLDGVTPEMDMNGDCVVDLKDIALMADYWLNCNRVPSCIPLP